MNSGDEYDLCNAAYNVQQAVEKLIKTALSQLGVTYSYSHRIEDLMAKLPTNQIIFDDDLVEKICDKAASLSEWKANTRYGEGYFVVRMYVEKCLKLAEQLAEALDAYLEGQEMSQATSLKRTVRDMNLDK